MNSVENILLAPLDNLTFEDFKKSLLEVSRQDRKRILKTINLNKYSSIFLKYLSEKKMYNLFTKDEISFLEIQRKRYQIQNLEIAKEVLNIDKIFKKNNLNPVYLKGVGLFHEFNDVSLRPSNDIDILFSEKEVYEAYNVLKKNGYEEFRTAPKSEEQLKNYAKKHHDLPELCRKTDIMIELHHRVTAPDDFDICPLKDQILKNKIMFNFYGINIHKPNINDLIIHLILHFSIQNFFENQIRIFFDISQIEKNYNIDWNEIYSSVDNLKIKKAILLSLGVFNYNFEMTNNFEYIRDKYSEIFPDSDIINDCFKRVLRIDSSKFPIKRLQIISRTENYFDYLSAIFYRIFLSKDDMVTEKRFKKTNFLTLVFHPVINFIKRLNFYLIDSIKLILKKGKVFREYESVLKIEKWIN
tara:strand:- start:2710 stop:3948 length:1239 start_codon:yes stop_codon:yes gene_type:complete